jgi:hypothetical protein
VFVVICRLLFADAGPFADGDAEASMSRPAVAFGVLDAAACGAAVACEDFVDVWSGAAAFAVVDVGGAGVLAVIAVCFGAVVLAVVVV